MSAMAARDVASTAEIRAHFPALRRTHAGHPVAYFDGPGGTQVPQSVADAMADYLLYHNANSGWAYPSSEETDEIVLAARAAMADLLGGRADEIAFGQNMTTLTLHLSRAMGRGWAAGDEIVVTELDHHANVDPWRHVARDRGLVVRTVAADARTGQLDMADLARQLGPRTRLLAIGAASNALGTRPDVTAAAHLAREAGALVFVDAVHYAPHVLTDVVALGCDFLACSPYKFYGPHLGVLWGRHHLLEALDVAKLAPAPAEAPDRLETGTLSFEAMAGATAAVDFLAGLAGDAGERRDRLGATFTALHGRGMSLVRAMWDGLAAIDGVRLFGPPPDAPRTPTVSFALRGRDARTVAHALAGRGVFASSGDFYASTIVAKVAPGPGGLVRAGCSCYTTAEEVARFVEAVGEVARG